MDLGRVVCLLVATAAGMMLWRFLAEGWRSNLGWKIVLATIGAASVVAYETEPLFGVPCAVVFGLLVLWPIALGSRVSQGILEQRYERAWRAARVLRWLHPVDGLWHQPALIEALALAQRGDLDAAVARFRALESRSALAPLVNLQILRLRGAWEELLTWARAPEGAPIASSAGAASVVLRALGETGQLETLVLEYARRAAVLDTPAQGTNRALSRLVLFSFTGDVASTKRLLTSQLAVLPEATRQFWLGTAEIAAGDAGQGRARLEAVRDSPDAIARAAIGRRLEQPLASPATLSNEARAYLDRLRADWELEERFAGPVAVARGAVRGTEILVLLNLLMFELEVARGASEDDQGLIQLGALVPSLVLRGQSWRLVTAMFLHAGWLHLSLNMIGLWALGRAVEANLRTRRFLVCYLGAGLGSMAVCTLREGVAARYLSPELARAWDDPLVGASGAIMGLVGAIGAIAFRGWWRQGAPAARRRLLGVMAVVGLQSAVDLSIPEVSFTGHISGVAIGFLIAALLAHPRTDRRPASG